MLLGLPHTRTHPAWSCCAFTGKILRFSPMMQSVGYQVTHFGVEGAESGATEQVSVLTTEEWRTLGGQEPGADQFGALAQTDSPLYRRFNQALVPLLRDRYQPGDVICLPFGHAHAEAVQQIEGATLLETGIGYPTAFAPFRVYESQAWMHFHLGKEQAHGSDYWWTIPNSYDPKDWRLGTGSGGYLLYFGRLNQDKGLDVVREIAKARPDLTVVICGQGDPSPWLTEPNIEARPPIHGSGRDELLGNALAVLMPTRYVEPFGGVAIEAMLCGTPVLASDFGAFTETIEPGWNGSRCRTLQDWVDGVDAAEAGHFNRRAIRDAAAGRYSMWEVAGQYARVFRQLADLQGDGWYTRRSAVLLHS